MNVNTITLDVSKEPAHEPTLYLGQSDKNGTTLVVNLFDNGAVLDLTGLAATFCMRTPGGSDYYQAVGTVSGNVATFLIDETYAAGHVGSTDIAYVKIADGDTVITSTSRIHVVVLPSATEGVEPAPAYQTLIDQFIEEAQADVDEIIDAAEQVLEDGIPLMSTTTRGGAKLGNGLAVDSSEKLNVQPATTSTIGGVKVDGTTVTVDSDGTIHSSGSGQYTLPTMDANTKGGAKLGTGLEVDSNDKLNVAISDASSSAAGLMSAADKSKLDGIETGANAYELPTMSETTKGGAKLGSSFGIDPTSEKLALKAATQVRIGGFKIGEGVNMDAYDCLNLKKASTSTLGGVKVDGTTITSDEDGTIHGASTYELPPATTSTLGGVIPDGTTIMVDGDGTIHGSGGGGDVTGVKGDAESTYRTGNVNLTPANIGAAASSHSHAASDITSGTLGISHGGTGETTIAAARAKFGSIPLALSSTGASTAAKTATLDGFELFAGARVLVNFSNANTYEGALTLNINNTGAKNVWAGGNLTSASNPVTWSADATCEFVYFGNSWAYLGNDTDGYEDYQAGQAISDLAAQVDELRDSVSPTATGNWYVRRDESSGFTEIWGKQTQSVPKDEWISWGNTYARFNVFPSISLPLTLDVVVSRQSSLESNGSITAILAIEEGVQSTASTTPSFSLVRGTSPASNCTYTLYHYIAGFKY